MRRLPKKPIRRIVSAARKRPVWSASILSYLYGVIRAALPNYLPDLNPWLLKPFDWLIQWRPKTGIGSFVEFVLLATVYISFVSWVAVRLRAVSSRTPDIQDTQWDEALRIYREEFAAAIESIDGQNGENPKEAIQNLLHAVAESLTVKMGLRHKDYRLLFFIPDPNMNSQEGRKEARILVYEIGHQFDLIRKGRLDPSTFKPMDSDIILDCLNQGVEEVIQRIEYLNSDVKAVLFVRNPGKLRLGLYIAILTEKMDIERANDIFPKLSGIIMTLAFVDPVREFIVEWNLGGGSDVTDE